MFFERIKSKRKTKNKEIPNLAMAISAPLKSLKSKLAFVITKSKATKTATIMKFIGLDLLKMLVIINSFCIFVL